LLKPVGRRQRAPAPAMQTATPPAQTWPQRPAAAAALAPSARGLPTAGCAFPTAGATAAVAIGAVGAVAASACGKVRRRLRRGPKRGTVALCATATASPWDVEPFEGCSFGGSVTGYDLRSALGDDAATERLRAAMARHRLLIFRGQDELTGADHIALSEQLGSLDHGLHRAHPRAPDPRLLRVSNDEAEGFISVGTSGWHVDGVMLRAPFAVQTMHFISAISGGDTLFLGFRELLGALEPEVIERCRRLWFVSGVGKNLAGGEGQLSLLPLVYAHPFTGEETMCFHLGGNYCLGWIEEQPQPTGLAAFVGGLLGANAAGAGAADAALQRLLAGTGGEGAEPAGFRFLPAKPTQELLKDLIDGLGEATRQCAVWRQRWADGDFALIDNLALAHLPVPGTQAVPSGPGEPGLRLFHRTTMTDAAAVPRNARGAASVLLVGGMDAEADLTGSRAGAIRDPKAMQAILRALMTATTRAAEADGEELAPKPRTRPGANKAAAQRLRDKMRAKLAE